MRRRKILSAGLGLLALTAVALGIGWWRVDGPGAPSSPGRDPLLPLPLAEMDFTLTDTYGRSIGPDDWIGQPLMVFFGYSYCPDICPTTLSEMSGWLEDLGARAERLQVAFVTVDPARDDRRMLAEYLGNFHPAITGYVGTATETARAAAGFRVKYQQVGTGQEYAVNHTAGVFLYDARGNFVSIIDYHDAPDAALKKIKRALE